MQIKLNREEIINKIHGCWIGKNIGGTMGAPFEGKRELRDISGFTTPKGEPLPNDDLDLQLVWLRAMETVGPKQLSANVLSDYWLSYIAPHWNEYGIAKNNLSMGLLPPLSGEVENVWKNSNGAWIRSEIWACLAPGFPNIAAKYAIMDASVDHGLSEGTYAEIFTATLESMAFFESDIRTLVDKALTFIPADCRVARSVKLVLEAYDKNIPWYETRELIVQDSKDLGWFQAPGNIAFAVLGLIYGEGDFKQSLIYAINCGDDTDCTAATCGSVLGIIMGADRIPSELAEYVGDRIVTMSINGSYHLEIPKTCTELTDRVMKLIAYVLSAYTVEVVWTDKEMELDTCNSFAYMSEYAQQIFARSPYSFEVPSLLHTSAVVEYECSPRIKPNSDFKVKVTFKNQRKDSHYYKAKAYLPDGWSAEYDRTCYTIYSQPAHGQDGIASWEMTIHIGETVEAVNRIVLTFTMHDHAVPIMIPVVLLG